MQTKDINDFQVIPIQLKNQNKKEPKHKLFFGNNKYPNIVIFAKKHSGKTMMLYNLIKDHKILDKNTKIIVFSSSVNKDQTYIDMVDYLRKKGNEVETYTSIFSDDGKRNQLKGIMDELQVDEKGKKKKKISSKKMKQEQIKNVLFKGMLHYEQNPLFIPEPKKEKKGGKYLTPKYIFIFDDLSKELRDPEIAKLMKSNRHYKATCFFIGHSPMDLNKSARTQTDILITFKGFQPSYVEHMRLFCNSPTDEKTFYKIYREATLKPYNFLWVDANTHQMRNNFNKEIII